MACTDRLGQYRDGTSSTGSYQVTPTGRCRDAFPRDGRQITVADTQSVTPRARPSRGRHPTIISVTPSCKNGNMRSIEVPEVADLEGLGPRDLARTLAELDRARRRVEALIAEAVGIAERSAAYAEDGHASVTGWVKATCTFSGGETKALVQCARLLHAIPEARAAAHAGQLGVSQGRLLARLHSNPRCADQFPASAELLVGHAASLWFDEFAVVVRRWEALADADGAHVAHERAHSGRDAHVSIGSQSQQWPKAENRRWLRSSTREEISVHGKRKSSRFLKPTGDDCAG